MTGLVLRRRNVEHHEAWQIVWGDIPVGNLSRINGTDGRMIWQWSCGFYPGCDKRTQQSAGREDLYEDAKAAFQAAWEQLEPQITSAMMDEWRAHHAFTEWKYSMWDAGCRLPTQNTSGRSRCFCGAEITITGMHDHVRAAHSS